MQPLLHKEKDGDLTCRASDFDQIFPRLHAYEETGLTPEQIIELLTRTYGPLHITIARGLELAQAEKEGRIMVLAEKPEPKVELNIYDKEEIIENCTVQILTNTTTGDISVGWWRGSAEDMP